MAGMDGERAAERDVFWAAMRQAFGGAGIALASSFFALGALFDDSGLEIWHGALCSLIVFALPGQLTAAELFAREAGLAVIVVSVLLVNLRLMPLTVALLPLLRPLSSRGWRDFAAAHLIAVTGWVCFMSTREKIPPPLRYRYFVWMGAAFWLSGVAATVLGYWAGEKLPPQLLLGLLFLNPIYFLCMMLRAVSRRAEAAAMLAGTLLLPPLHFVGEWDIVASGLIGGAAVWLIAERGRKAAADDFGIGDDCRRGGGDLFLAGGGRVGGGKNLRRVAAVSPCVVRVAGDGGGAHRADDSLSNRRDRRVADVVSPSGGGVRPRGVCDFQAQCGGGFLDQRCGYHLS